jgi:hypothetical protein
VYNPNDLFGPNETLSDDQAELEELGTVDGEMVQPQPQQQVADPDIERQIREIEAENNGYREQIWRYDERQRALNEARQGAERAAQQQREEQERPDPEIDPVGHQLYNLEQRSRQMQAWQQQQQQQWQQYEQQRQNQEYNNYVQAEGQRFTKQQPDYVDAANYAAAKRMEAWQAAGHSSEQARQIVMHEANAWIQSNRIARQQGRTNQSFPEFFYGLARQWGYVPKKR